MAILPVSPEEPLGPEGRLLGRQYSGHSIESMLSMAGRKLTRDEVELLALWFTSRREQTPRGLPPGQLEEMVQCGNRVLRNWADAKDAWGKFCLHERVAGIPSEAHAWHGGAQVSPLSQSIRGFVPERHSKGDMRAYVAGNFLRYCQKLAPRSRKTGGGITISMESPPDPAGAPHLNLFSGDVVEEEARQRLAKWSCAALLQLKDRQRAEVRLYLFADAPMQHRDIAERLGVNEGAVRTSYHRSLQSIRAALVSAAVESTLLSLTPQFGSDFVGTVWETLDIGIDGRISAGATLRSNAATEEHSVSSQMVESINLLDDVISRKRERDEATPKKDHTAQGKQADASVVAFVALLKHLHRAERRFTLASLVDRVEQVGHEQAFGPIRSLEKSVTFRTARLVDQL